MRPGHPGLMGRDRPFIWGDRYDLFGLALGVVTAGALALLGVPVLLAIVLGCAVVNLTAFALRRRAGIPLVTIWQRMRR